MSEIELVFVEWNNDSHYYCKGHVDIEAFKQAVRDEMGLYDTDDPGGRHAYMRQWPNKNPDLDWAYRISEENGPGRGVFKATVTWAAVENPSESTREAWKQ